METVVIIPARYQSTRFPGKPLVELLGKPVICWVAERVAAAQGVGEVVVATDDDRIASAVKALGFRAIMTSVNHKSGTDRIAEVAASMQSVEIIVNVQGDEPMVHPEMVETAVKPLLKEPSLVMSTLKRTLEDLGEYYNPNTVKVVTDKDNNALYFSRAAIPYYRDGDPQVVPDGVFAHIGLYVYRRDFLLHLSRLSQTPLEKAEKLEQLRALENGYRIKVMTTIHQTIGIDTPEDLERVQHIMKSQDAT